MVTKPVTQLRKEEEAEEALAAKTAAVKKIVEITL